ncbi:MAG: hypothetical protein U0232_10990 [Thermomicrobiales bacterium]
MNTPPSLLILLVILAAIGARSLLVGLRRTSSPVALANQARTQAAYPYEGMIIGFEEIGNGRDGRGAFRSIDFAFEIQPRRSPLPDPHPPGRSTPAAPRPSNWRTVAIKVDLDDPPIIYPDLPGVEYHWSRAQALLKR